MGLCLLIRYCCKSCSCDNDKRSSSSSDSPPRPEPPPERPQPPPIPPLTPPAPPSSNPAPPPKEKPRSRPSSGSSRIGAVLERPYVDITSIYDLEGELGRGQFGITYLCTDKSTGRKYACKSISKRKLVTMEDIEDVKTEILILQHLSGQPNIVEFKGAYEDRQNLHLVMELCSGGELFDRIIARGHFSERAAARVIRQIVNIVHVCHSMGVLHRDLKPENFLLATKREDSPLKVTDFGLSVFIEEGKLYKEFAGSPYYMAPEIIKGRYGKEIDVWSAGVMAYVILCGVPRFCAETQRGIFKAILDGHLDLKSSPWPHISSSAKDLVKKMLTKDPKRRITASQALEHPWLLEGARGASDKTLDSAVLIRMKQFRAMNKLKKLALKVIAENYSEEELKGLQQMFSYMDKDGSGGISFDELKVGLARLGSKLSEPEIKQLMEAADVDKNGIIDYVEFITAIMHHHKLEKEEHLFKSFQFFDKEGKGFITRDELKQVISEYGMGDDATIDEVIDDVDTDKNGRIDYDEFVAMMRKGIAGSSRFFHFDYSFVMIILETKWSLHRRLKMPPFLGKLFM